MTAQEDVTYLLLGKYRLFHVVRLRVLASHTGQIGGTIECDLNLLMWQQKTLASQ